MSIPDSMRALHRPIRKPGKATGRGARFWVCYSFGDLFGREVEIPMDALVIINRKARQGREDLDAGLEILAYLRNFLLAYRSNASFDADVVCDGVEHHLRSIQIGVCNGRHYGGGMVVSEDAEPDDHLLSLYSLVPQSILRLASLAYALRTGRYRGREKVVSLRGAEIENRKTLAIPPPGFFLRLGISQS